MSPAVSFEVTREEYRVIDEITDRATRAAIRARLDVDRMAVQMDLTATHANGCPLRLHDLLVADDFNFNHDVFGIIRHLDRTTGTLRNCFVPRFAIPERVIGGGKAGQ